MSDATPAAAARRTRSARDLVGAARVVDWPTVLRPAFVALQALTILITWPLWQARSNPPTVPVVHGLPQVDVGWALLVSLAVVLFKPAIGVAAHVAVLVVAFALDQTRLQPEVVSLAILLIGTTTLPYARVVARAHLASLWLWAGLNKALSLGFAKEGAPFLYDAFPLHVEPLRAYFGWIVIAAETSIGVLLLVRRLRPIGVALAMTLHVLGLVALVSIGWNDSVWPWNAALVVAAPAFFLFDSHSPRRERKIPAIAIALVIGLYPAGFYAGIVDAYMAHSLYASNTARAVVCDPSGTCSPRALATWDALDVPLPPEPRLFRDLFRQTCKPGDELVVFPRRTRILFGFETSPSRESCPA